MKAPVTFLLLFFVQLSFSQNNSTIAKANSYTNTTDSKETERALYNQKLSQESVTLKLNLSDISPTTINNLKEEMIGYDGKVTLVEWDNILKEMLITHNGLIKKKDVFEILEKYNISKSTIISYQ